jgi:hypothetical protein
LLSDPVYFIGECIIIATGSGKREALLKVKEGEVLPVGLVEPDVWFVDEDAVCAAEKA